MQAMFAGIRASALRQTRALQVRLQRTTQRERILLAGLVLGALVYAPIAVLDWRQQQEDLYTNAVVERSAARLARSASERITANSPDTAEVEDMRSWGMASSNAAIAQVRVEQMLIEATTNAGLANVKITTDPDIEVIGPTQWLNAQVQADLKWAPTFAFLDALTGWSEGFRITQFQYEVTTTQAFMEANPTIAPAGRVQIGVAVPVTVPVEVEAAP